MNRIKKNHCPDCYSPLQSHPTKWAQQCPVCPFEMDADAFMEIRRTAHDYISQGKKATCEDIMGRTSPRASSDREPATDYRPNTSVD